MMISQSCASRFRRADGQRCLSQEYTSMDATGSEADDGAGQELPYEAAEPPECRNSLASTDFPRRRHINRRGTRRLALLGGAGLLLLVCCTVRILIYARLPKPHVHTDRQAMIVLGLCPQFKSKPLPGCLLSLELGILFSLSLLSRLSCLELLGHSLGPF